MAGSSLLALLDDIATILDDVAVLTKVGAKKASGVLGDDLALNAEQVSGVLAERELPVVWAVAKGSALNKAMLVPAALAISAFIPWAITPLLMLGGTFLCYEGFEKLAHKLFGGSHEDVEEHKRLVAALAAPAVDVVAFEREKIKGAIRTDFVLSAEIVAIVLGIVANEPLTTQVGVLTMMSILMTVGVYGLVAGIVKLDDLGLMLTRRAPNEAGEGGLKHKLGVGILKAAPYLMKALGIVGTIAMFLVGGGILGHGIPGFEAFVQRLTQDSALLGAVLPTLANGVLGVLAGAVALGAVSLLKRLFGKRGAHP
jgi:predicted DNA repair protein MutK